MTQTESVSVQLVTQGQEARVDSRELALALGNQHDSLLSLFGDYQGEFEQLGLFRFEIGKASGGRPPRYALLNEDQSYFLLTLVRNSPTVVKLKLRLVQLFKTAREGQPAPLPALPADPLLAQLQVITQMRQEQLQLVAEVREIGQRLDASPITSEKVAVIHRLGQQLGALMGNYRTGWRLFNERFNLASYRDLPTNQFEAGQHFLKMQIAAYTGRPLYDQ